MEENEVRVIDEDLESEPYPIRPEDINTDCRQFLGAFGMAEVEVAAQYVVRLCQQLGGWKAFTKESLDKFYLENGGAKEWVFNRRNTFPFYWLDNRLLENGPDGKCRVTDFFINRCFHSSPKKKNP